jgi:N-acetylglucosamine kinase-like BadF-type ATPase
MTAIFGIDAGGTRTRIVIDAPGRPPLRCEAGSISRATVDETAAREHLRETFGIVGHATAQHDSVGWVASAGVVPETISAQLMAIHELLPRRTRRLAVSNDAVPLLLTEPLLGRGVVVVAGTGSGILGGNGEMVMRIGDHDYLGGDRGSAFHIGLLGLRAALRAHDGVGPRSSLTATLSEHAGRHVVSESRRLAALPFPKQAVARLAAPVLRCWRDQDDVADAVVTAAVDALAAGTARMRGALRLPATAGTVVAGGLITGAGDFGAAVHDAIKRTCGPHDVTVCDDPAAKVLSCARTFIHADGRPAVGRTYLGTHVWLTRRT